MNPPRSGKPAPQAAAANSFTLADRRILDKEKDGARFPGWATGSPRAQIAKLLQQQLLLCLVFAANQLAESISARR
jgi:hypothetical protein